MSAHAVAIVDYGLGNLFSVERALKKIGVSDVVISCDRDVLEQAHRLILPGVGAFGEGMNHLRELDLVAVIRDYALSGRPILGVCLGLQLFLSESYEFGLHRGLDLVQGRVEGLRPGEDSKLKVPHIGWSSLKVPPGREAAEKVWQNSILNGLGESSYMYFLHSFVVIPEDPRVCIATTWYGRDTFCSVLKRGNITGVQFHPERSGEDGLNIYRNFMKENGQH